MKLSLGDSWTQKLQKRVQGFEFEVGVLNDDAHKFAKETGKPSDNITSYAGGPVQKTSNVFSEKTTGEILVENMTRMNENILAEPFKKKNSDILKFTEGFLKLVTERPGISIKRVENLLQAIVRNPILRMEYGNNKASTADAKGFDRHLFGTGQLFKAITAKVKKRV